MIEYIFVYDLEKERKCKDSLGFGRYEVRYYHTENGGRIEIGDGFRHNLIIESEYWNSIIGIIRGNKLNGRELDAIVKGLIRDNVGAYGDNLVSAIKKGKIAEFDYQKEKPRR